MNNLPGRPSSRTWQGCFVRTRKKGPREVNRLHLSSGSPKAACTLSEFTHVHLSAPLKPVRSSFKSLIFETVTEESLAHSLGKVEAAYRRGAAIERRRELMETWADLAI